MSGVPAIDEDAEDAAFRARLAPLSAEVLPMAVAQTKPVAEALPPRRGRGGLALSVALGGSLLGGGALVYATWPGAPAVPAGGASTSIMSPVAVSPLAVSPLNETAPAAPNGAAISAEDRDMIALLMARGQTALAVNDIAAARMLFERAAGLGSAAAAGAAGKTHDIAYLLETGARGILGDPAAAAAWYRKAAALGDPEAKARLARLEGRAAK